MLQGRNVQHLRDLGRIFGQGVLPSEDRALLDCFMARRDEAAFEALVIRHGPMVKGVCGRLLNDSHDADDAFQATFLILILKSRRIRDADRLGPWLYGVATRVALKARAKAARRRDRHDGQVDELGSREANHDLLDVMPILDAELGRLPAKLREVLVLCLLEGATAEEAAGRLACPLGTVKSRLARGREALRSRLTSRGVAPAVALAAVSSVFASPVSAALIRATVASATASRIAPAIIALTRGVAPAMISKSAAVALLLAGGVALSAGGVATWLKVPAQAQEPGRPPAVQVVDDWGMNQSIRNMKMLMLAVHNYYSTYDRLPPAAITGANDEPKLSWRVALLPFLEDKDANALYNEFHFDEAWDSPHNKALIGRMPDIFKTPHSPAGDGMTRIRGFDGPGSLFDGNQRIGFADVTDGTSNTTLIALAAEAAPWTKPGELPFHPGRAIPPLDEVDWRGWIVGTADGAVHHVKKGNRTMMRDSITRAGGEKLEPFPNFQAPRPDSPRDGSNPPPATPRLEMRLTPTAVAPAPTPAKPLDAVQVISAPQGLELRLQRMEERLRRVDAKLDQVLRRLDSLPPDVAPREN